MHETVADRAGGQTLQFVSGRSNRRRRGHWSAAQADAYAFAGAPGVAKRASTAQ